MAAHPISEQVATDAAEWFFRLAEKDATQAEHDACTCWREADPSHELAWQRAQRIKAHFNEIPADIGVPALNARKGRRAAVQRLASLLVVSAGAWLAWRSEPMRQMTADYRTAVGQRREIMLADGSRLHLNTGTAIDVRFDAGQRLLVLHAGEVHIDTGADRDSPAYRPFLVQTAQGRIRALGTRFNVRIGEVQSRVAVTQGAVEITSANGAQLVVQANHQAVFNQRGVEGPQSLQAGVEDWLRGVLRVHDQRLDDFLTELGRYRQGLLRCDLAVAALRVSGVFQLQDIDAVLDSLPNALPVNVLYRTRYWVTVVPAA